MESKPQNFVTNYGVVAICTAESLRADHCVNLLENYHPQTEDITLIVTSKKRQKITAAKLFFDRFPQFSGITIQPMGVQARSDIAEQPFGLSNGLMGCLNRIKDAKNFVPPNKGIFYFATQQFINEPVDDVGTINEYIVIVVETDDGSQSTFITDGMTLPIDILHLIEKECGAKTVDDTGYDKSIGDILEKYFGMNNSSWYEQVTEPPLSETDRILSTITA
eukprot:gene6983-14197_t